MGETPQRLAKEVSFFNLLGLSPARSSRPAYSAKPAATPGGIVLHPSSRRSKNSSEKAHSGSPRTQRESGGCVHVAKFIPQSEARGHRGELFRRELAQTSAQLFRRRHAQAMQLVGGLRPRLDSRATGGAQDPDHLHAPVAALGHTRRLHGKTARAALWHRRGRTSGRCAARFAPSALALHLKHLDPPGPRWRVSSAP